MDIFIPTQGRADKQLTFSQIPPSLHSKVWLVMPNREAAAYKAANPTAQLMPHPDKIKGIAKVRQWIADINSVHAFYMDDDLKLEKRTYRGRKIGLTKAEPLDIENMFGLMEQWLAVGGLAACGLSSRFGNNWIKEDYVECCRPCMAYGVNTEIMRTHGIRFDDVEVCEDYHVMISLLRAGFKNRMTALYTASDSGVGKPGGTTVYRTSEMVLKNMQRMVQMHRPYVSLRVVKGLTQGFQVGYELRVAWKKAYDDGRKGSLL